MNEQIDVTVPKTDTDCILSEISGKIEYLTPTEFIASLPHGESKATALKVYNLMTPTENEELVSIQPKHLRLMKFHLSQYLNTLCEQAEAGEKVKEINELGSLDYVIDTLLEAHCNDTA